MKLPSFQAADAYFATKSVLNAAPTKAEEGGAVFEAVHKLAGAVEKGEQASIALMTTGADPHSVVEAMAAAELAIETAVTVRDKIVEAYQELMRMPV